MTVALAAAVYCFAGYRFYSLHRQQTWSGMEAGLVSMAAEKARYVERWRASNRRMAEDVESVMLAFGLESKFAAESGPWTLDPNAESALRGFLNRNDVKAFHLLDSSGDVRYSFGDPRGLAAEERQEIREAMGNPRAALSEPHRPGVGERPHLHTITPFQYRRGGTDPIGGMVLTVEMSEDFQDHLRHWPTRSRTGEVALVRRDGDRVVILNEPTRGADGAIPVNVPIDKRDMVAARAAAGDKGFVEGRDCRGVPVLAALRPIAGSNWGLIVKVDRAEVEERLSRQTRSISLVCLLLTAVTGLGLYFLRMRQAAVTIRQRMQADLERATVEEHYREVLGWSLESYLEVDPEGHIVDANPAFSELTGYSRAELIGMSLLQLDVSQSAGEMRERIAKLRLAGSEVFETTIKRKDGVFRAVEGNAVWAKSGAASFYFFLRDVTDRKQAEEAIRESERMTREFMESVTLFAVTLGPAGEILFLNDYLLRRTGWSESEVLGRNWFDIFVPETDRTRIAEDFRASIEAGTFRPRYENRVIGKDGHIFRVGWTVTSQSSADGSIARVTSIGEDLTERRRIQEELARTQRLDSLARLAGGVAHDFNNLLTVINGYCELLLMRMKPDDPLRAHADEIFKAGERASAMTQQLLAFGKMRASQEGACDVNAVLCEGRSLFRHLLGEDVELRYELAAGPQWVRGSGGQLHQVLLNLILNARDALPMGGKCIIATKPVALSKENPISDAISGEGAYVQLSVQDTGVGMPEETRRRLFEPFFTTKQVGQGTGLGLASVYGIVKQNEGFIEVHSKAGKGSRFDIYLPAGVKLRRDETASNPRHAHEGETILVVEDQEEVRQLECECLRSLGYTVLPAENGEAALTLLRNGGSEVRLVMTDVVMPGMNGADLAVRVLEMRPGLPILFASGYEKGSVVQSRDWPTKTRFIAKPFRPEELSHSIRELLDA